MMQNCFFQKYIYNIYITNIDDLRGGGTFQPYNYQNSLITRLNYIKITLKVDFMKKIGPWPPQHFFRGRGKKNFRAQIRRTQIFLDAPNSAPPGKILYPPLPAIYNPMYKKLYRKSNIQSIKRALKFPVNYSVHYSVQKGRGEGVGYTANAVHLPLYHSLSSPSYDWSR